MSVDVGRAVGYLELDTSNFSQGFQTALNDLKTFEDSTASIEDKLASVGGAMSSVGSTMTKSVTLPLAGIGAAFVKTTSSFDEAMSQVQATMGITAEQIANNTNGAADDMEALRNIAKEMGASTKFTASEAAEGLNYMALAGYDAQTSIKMLPTVLNLAAAGAMELGTASDVVTDVQSALGLSLDETTVLIDQMAKTASSSNTSVAQLGEALLTIGGTARFMAGGTEEVTTVLGILADNGIKASEGGTKLRNMLLKLSSPTDAGAAALSDLNVQVFDAEGNMRKFSDIFGDLENNMNDVVPLVKDYYEYLKRSSPEVVAKMAKDAGGMLDKFGINMVDNTGKLRDWNDVLEAVNETYSTGALTDEQKIQYLSDIFNTRDVAAATALMNTASERWVELEDKIVDSAGAAQQMSETQLDNLKGQLTILKSALEGLAISFGELMMPVIRSAAKWIQKLVDWMNSLDEETRKTILTVAGIVAAIGPVLLIGGKLITGVGKLISVVRTVSTVISSSGGIIAGLASPIGLIIAAVAALALAWATDFGGIREKTAQIFEKLKELFSALWGFITRLGTSIKGELEKFWAFVTELWDSNFLGIRTIVTTAVDIIETIFGGFLDLILDELQLFIDLFNGDWEAVAADLTKIWEDLVGIVTSIGSKLFEAGREIFNLLWDGLKQTWEDIKSWFSDKIDWISEKVKFWNSKVREIQNSEAYQMGGFGGSISDIPTITSTTPTTVVNNNTYTFTSPKALTPYETATQMDRAVRGLAFGR